MNNNNDVPHVDQNERDMIIQQQQLLIQQQQTQLFQQQQQLLQQQQFIHLQQNQQQQLNQQMSFTTTTTTSSTNILANVARINTNSEPCEILNGTVLLSPKNSEWFGSDMKGTFKVRVIRGTNLMAADSHNNLSDPYVKIKSSCISDFPQTKVVNANLNPIWEETFTMSVESVRTELLMFKVFDKDIVGSDDLLGYFGVNLSLLPLGIEVITREKLYFAEHGTIEIGITALDFGLTNIPANYVEKYIEWRNNLPVLEKKEFKTLAGSKTHSFMAKRMDIGPFQNKVVHPDFKIVRGFVKLKKSAKEKFTDGLKTAGLVTATVAAVIVTAPFTTTCSQTHW